MSEYQYYEFQAIDRPLSDGDMRNLRAFSTRARITRTSFVNEYQWGSFKGDEDAWMAKYFDAFLYCANWNTRIIKLRVPAGVIAAATARRYCRPGALDLREDTDAPHLHLRIGRRFRRRRRSARGDAILVRAAPAGSGPRRQTRPLSGLAVVRAGRRA
jgi:hypothetical protein